MSGRRMPARLVLAAGIGFSLYLQSLPAPGVMNLSDAGLKALQAQQFSTGALHLDLRLRAQPWVGALWDSGLYPFKEPHVYAIDGRRYSRFSIFLPLLAAPFYALLGFRGLLIVPLLGVWALWWAFLRACEGLRASPLCRALGLASLIFASFVTYYSATFWEHTAAAALGFLGVAIGFAQPFQRPPRTMQALVAGLATGGAVWLREEFVCLVGIAGLLGLLASSTRWERRWSKAATVAWVCGLAVPPTLLFGLNTATFGSPMGVHGLNVVEALSDPSRRSGLESIVAMTSDLVAWFPLFPLALLAVFIRGAERRRARLLVAVCVGLAISIPWLVRVQGKEWGPRFLAGVVPFACLALVLLAERFRRSPAVSRAPGLLAIAVLFGLGFQRNTLEGSRELAKTYARRAMTLDFVRGDPRPVVAVGSEFIAELLAPACPEKIFFLVEDGEALGRLARGLGRERQERFLYLADPNRASELLRRTPEALTLGVGHGLSVSLQRGAVLDRYLIYDGTVRERSRP